MSPVGGAGRENAAPEVEREQGAEVGGAASGSPGAGVGGRGAKASAGDRGSEPPGAAARNRAALETFARHEASLRRTALRFSICADDAEEALQRGLEILLQKAPTDDHRDLVRWTQTVVRHEALAVRAERERVLAGPAALPDADEDWVEMLPTEADGPAERAERHEAIERSREALTTLKPQELRALTLLAEGYSYEEIGQITGYSPRKVNRALAEGRERFRRFLAHRDGGARCTELAPLISAFADGEAGADEVATLREHLRSCPYCRATLRAYRAAPRAAAALAPALPLRDSLADRLHDAYVAVATRVGGGTGASDSALGGLAAAGGSRGAGMAALAKVLAICAGTVGGAAACVATGVVPAPLLDPPEHHSVPAAKVSHRHRPLADEEAVRPTVEYETEEPAEIEAEPAPTEREAQPEEHQKKPKEEEPQATEEAAAATVSTPPPSESGATEYVEPAPAPEPTSPSSGSGAAATTSSSSSSSASSGTAAGEFGP